MPGETPEILLADFDTKLREALAGLKFEDTLAYATLESSRRLRRQNTARKEERIVRSLGSPRLGDTVSYRIKRAV